MAGTIHGSGAYTALEIAACQTFGEDPSYPSSWHRVPLAGETMRFEREPSPEPNEISVKGAATSADYLWGSWRGEFTTPMYYNSIAQQVLLCQAFGGVEGFVADKSPTQHACTANTANTHFYIPQSFRCTTEGSKGAIPYGIAIRLWKSGSSLGGYIEKVLGVKVTGVRFFQEENGHPMMTFFIEGGIEPTLSAASAGAPVAKAANLVPVRFGDLSKDSTHPKMPSGLYQGLVWGKANIDRYEITFRNGIEFPKKRYLTDLDSLDTAGHVSPISVEASFATRADQTDLAEAPDSLLGKVYFSTVAGRPITQPAWARLRYISAVSGTAESEESPYADHTANLPYCLQIDIPMAMFLSSQASVSDGGAVRLEYSMRAYRNLINFQGNVATSTAYQAPLHVQCFMKRTDDGDGKINIPSSTGGNDPDSSLL